MRKGSMSEDIAQPEEQADTAELRELAELSEKAREAIAYHAEAMEVRREAMRQAWIQGAKKSQLQAAGQVSYRTVGNVIQGVKRSPQMGAPADLAAVEAAAEEVAAAEQAKREHVGRRDRAISTLLDSQRYPIAQLMQASKLGRATLYKSRADAQGPLT